jgi:nitrite reductase (NO-forming)/hydroxylamine reductase
VSVIRNVGRHLHDAFRSPDGRYVAMASYDDNILAIIDLLTKKVVKRLPAERQPHVGSGAVIESGGRTLGVGTNIGIRVTGEHYVTVFDMETFEVVKQIPVLGPTESPAAHPLARYIAVDIVGSGARESMIQLIDKKTLSVARTIDVGGHSHLPEYTARGDFLYVSAGYKGDKLVIYDARTLNRVRSFSMEVPSGIFSYSRARTPVVGLQKRPE